MSDFVEEKEGESKGPSKGELKKLQKKLEKEAKKAEYKLAEGVQKVQLNESAGASGVDELAHLYGDSELICSKFISSKTYEQISDINEDFVGKEVWIRARIHTSRAVGKGVFLLLRQSLHSIQAIAWQSERVSKGLIKYASAVSLESVVDGEKHVGYNSCLYYLNDI